jgi:hypothetical protein
MSAAEVGLARTTALRSATNSAFLRRRLPRVFHKSRRCAANATNTSVDASSRAKSVANCAATSWPCDNVRRELHCSAQRAHRRRQCRQQLHAKREANPWTLRKLEGLAREHSIITSCRQHRGDLGRTRSHKTQPESQGANLAREVGHCDHVHARVRVGSHRAQQSQRMRV